ncbi:hypothetical membrane protein [Renibacterium salmoninarum ATCC 33209]|uniref:Hypothetical membrane protein n=1 Tax=Renibacterium salmoninarum (strain ATCC 33209 / DSM 20767 / JCM 11484 / NBRC 15589 / NCIMB 2235) TaxID=288705 RepID=A9WLL7_RENSM|nr:hypothetical protein [Renibacterium salmoninarum]ABY22375.1 hypothetical membrane protein [Renibacterium salmoninarum ATCC 33209]
MPESFDDARPQYGQRDPFLEANGFYSTPPVPEHQRGTPRKQDSGVVRGTLCAMLIIPAGIALWVFLWSFGWMASLVSLGVSFGAFKLYTLGSKGRLSKPGVWSILTVTVVTMVLAFLAGIWYDMMKYTNSGFFDSFVSRHFWRTLTYNLFQNPNFWPAYAMDMLGALLFCALGSFFIIRSLFRQAK